MTLLTVEDLRKWPAYASVDEDVLQMLLDAEEQAIERELGGPVGAVTEILDGGALVYNTLRRRAASITSITSLIDGISTTLHTSDWRLRNDRRTLMRLGTGTNPAGAWSGTATVLYAPEDDEDIRKRVQRELIDLDLNTTAGATSEQIGAWMEQQQKSSVWNQATERRAILDTLYAVEPFDFA